VNRLNTYVVPIKRKTMSETDILVLTDKLIIPTPELLSSILGEKSILWDRIVQTMKADYAGIEEVWRYYNDGKQWLFRLIRKKKTIFWIGVLKDTFRVSFYFGDKAEDMIESSNLPDHIKKGFKTAKRYNNFRGITIKVFDSNDADNILKLAAIKMKLK
jgi:hypothetical protein